MSRFIWDGMSMMHAVNMNTTIKVSKPLHGDSYKPAANIVPNSEMGTVSLLGVIVN